MFVYFLLIRTAAPRAPSVIPRTGAGLSVSCGSEEDGTSGTIDTGSSLGFSGSTGISDTAADVAPSFSYTIANGLNAVVSAS